MLAKVQSTAVLGIDGFPVTVEVDLANGLPSFIIVGLPDGSVRESKDRVKAAIKNSGYSFPTRKITINLAPADLKKEGTAFDLPIALGLLMASEIIKQGELSNYLAIGELSLDGSIRPVPGILPMALSAVKQGVKGFILPAGNAREASLVAELDIVPVDTLFETVEILNGLKSRPRYQLETESPAETYYPIGFEDIKGQKNVKRALEIAASGMHNVLLKGPPGTGKTLIARSLPSILPDLSFNEKLETSRIYSVIGNNSAETVLVSNRPFRAPHHTISDAGLIGGGTIPRPGEVSLAHNGVLFLDELPEFKKHVLEVLRQPLEDGTVTISRAHTSLTFPARFMLVAAMNPCPCGYHGDRKHDCHCNDLQIQRYQSRISGPLLDRIDIHLEVPALDFEGIHSNRAEESSRDIRKRVNQTRMIQKKRFRQYQGIHANGQMGAKEIGLVCTICERSKQLLKTSVEKLGLSARAYHRILKLSRTIADMDGSEEILFQHVAEAVQYRRGDFNG